MDFSKSKQGIWRVGWVREGLLSHGVCEPAESFGIYGTILTSACTVQRTSGRFRPGLSAIRGFPSASRKPCTYATLSSAVQNIYAVSAASNSDQ